MSVTLISTVTVGAGGAGSIDFTSIPQTYTDLYLVIGVRSNTTGNTEFQFKLNGSDPTSAKVLRGSGSTASSTSNLNIFAPAAGNTANTFSNIAITIPNYAGTTNKSVSVDATTENNVAASQVTQEIHAMYYSSSAGVTSISIVDAYGIWVQYSSASLYGITKGTLAGVTVA